MFCTALDETGESGTGDTGAPNEECVPNLSPDEVGYAYTCQGLGNGWLVLDVFGAGVQPPECVNWGPDGKPGGDATTADCVPVDLTMLPSDVPSPGACCTQGAFPGKVETQCSKDCGYAACTLAVAKIREAALALPHPDSEGLKKAAEERVRGDLFGLANMLELPEFLAGCAEQVTMANGEPTQVLLGAGMSSDDLIGHINNATLTLQCALDADEPYVLEGGSCESTPNIPLIDGESNVGGSAAAGAITMFTPSGSESVHLSNITFEFRELYKRDGSADFVLTTFEADTADAKRGLLSFHAPHIQLAEPITAPLVDGMVTFPPGSLRIRSGRLRVRVEYRGRDGGDSIARLAVWPSAVISARQARARRESKSSANDHDDATSRASLVLDRVRGPQGALEYL